MGALVLGGMPELDLKAFPIVLRQPGQERLVEYMVGLFERM